jgi:hypothetical protein
MKITRKIYLAILFALVFSLIPAITVSAHDEPTFEQMLEQLRQEFFAPQIQPFGFGNEPVYVFSDEEFDHTPPIDMSHLLIPVADGFVGFVPATVPSNYVVNSRRQFNTSRVPTAGSNNNMATLVRQGAHVNIWVMDGTPTIPSGTLDAAIVQFDDITFRMTRDFAPFEDVRIPAPFSNMNLVGDIHNDGRVNLLIYESGGWNGGYFSSGHFMTNTQPTGLPNNVPIAAFAISRSSMDSDNRGPLYAHELQHLLFYIHFGVYITEPVEANALRPFAWFNEALSELAWLYWGAEGQVSITRGNLFNAAGNSYSNPSDGRIGDFVSFNNSGKNYAMGMLYSMIMHRRLNGEYASNIYEALIDAFPQATTTLEFTQRRDAVNESSMATIVGNASNRAGLSSATGEEAFSLLYFLFMEAFAADGGNIISGGNTHNTTAFLPDLFSAHNFWGMRPSMGFSLMDAAPRTHTLFISETSFDPVSVSNRTAFPTLTSGGTITLNGYDGTPALGATHEMFYRLTGESTANPVLNITIPDTNSRTQYYVVVPNEPAMFSSSLSIDSRQAGRNGATVHHLSRNTPNFIQTEGRAAYLFVVTFYRNVSTTATYTWQATMPVTQSDNNNLSALGVTGQTLDPVFAAANTAYTMNVPNDVAQITITATAECPYAMVQVFVGGSGLGMAANSISQAVNLNVGENEIIVRVIAENDDVRNYTLTVTRAAPTYTVVFLMNSFQTAGVNATASLVTQGPFFANETVQVRLAFSGTANATGRQAAVLRNMGEPAITPTPSSVYINLIAGATPDEIIISFPMPAANVTMLWLELLAGINSAEISVAAPAIGASPNTTATPAGGSNFTAGAVTWSPAHSPFQASTTYTATITLTANPAHTFFGFPADGATINDASATIVSNNNETLVISRTFTTPAPTPNISVQPVGGTFYRGGSAAVLSVTASATEGTLSYQWYENGTAISGATNASFTAPTNTDGTQTYYVVITNTLRGQTATAQSNTVTVTTETAMLNTVAEVAILGNAVFGGTLTANVSLLSTPPISDYGTVTYSWTHGDATPIGGNTPTYTIQADDIGQAIRVTISAANTEGNIQSAATAVVTHAEGAAVTTVATAASTTANSITINAATLAAGSAQTIEYAINQNATTAPTSGWQTTLTFGGLDSGVTYYVWARSAENTTHSAGTPSASAGITTLHSLTLSPASVNVNDSSLTPTVTSGGTATGTISFSGDTLPDGVTIAASGNTITVTGVRPAIGQPNIVETFYVTVSRDNATPVVLTIIVNLTAHQPTAITTAAVNVTAPATGDTPATTASITTPSPNFSVSAVTWLPTDNPFTATTQYTAHITLNAASGYTFEGIAAENVTINSALAAITNNMGSILEISYQFAQTSSAAANEARLSSLGISSGILSPTFNSNTNAYTVSVANNVSSITISAEAISNMASIAYSFNGSDRGTGAASDAISLAVGSANVITVLVTAEDGTTSQAYTITVTRAEPAFAVGFAVNDITRNGLTATGDITPSGNLTAGTPVTVTVTLSGTAGLTGTHTIGLTSEFAQNGLVINAPTPVTFNVTQAGAITPQTYTFTFTMLSFAVGDLTVVHTFAADPPTVTSVSPGGTSVSVNTNTVSITFNQAMNTSVNGAVTLTEGANTITLENPSWSGNVLTMDIPGAPLDFATLYTVNISGWRSMNFYNVVMVNDSTYTFTTSAATVTLSNNPITVNDSNLTPTTNVGGTATGAISFANNNLPAGVSIAEAGGVITVTGVRPAANTADITGTYTVNVVRGGITETLSVIVSLTQLAPTLSLSPATVSITDGSLTSTSTASTTATGTITFTNNNLPSGVTIAAVGDVITVTGVRPAFGQPNINDSYTVTVNRQSATQVLTVNVNLTAMPPVAITSSYVSVSAPAFGGTPQTTFADANSQWDAAILWSPPHSPFEAETAYTASITITPRSGYTLDGVAAGFFRVNGSVPTAGNAANAGVLSFTFPATGEAPPTAITSAAVTVTAPATAVAPNTTATPAIASDFTASAVTWSPVNSSFLGGTQYTAMVTLTVVGNFTFTGLTSATINGSAATVSNNTGGTVTLSYIFPATTAATVTGIAVQTQPTNLTYIAGEILNLAGLAVNLTFNDGTVQNNIALASFGDYGITTAPAGGTALTVATHNGQPITVSANGFSATTNNLIVNAPTLILTPSTITINDSALTATTAASGTASGAITFSGDALPSAVSISYAGNVITVTGVRPAFGSAAISGSYAVTVTRSGISETLTVNVSLTPLPPAVITSAGIAIAAPSYNAIPTAAFADANGQWDAAISWSPSHSPFEAETIYTAEITITPRSGYTLDGVAVGFFRVNGSVPTVGNAANAGVLSFTFPATGEAPPTPITEAAINVAAPLSGEAPATSATGANAMFNVGSVSWDGSPAVFVGNTRYTVNITLTAQSGFTFEGISAVSINGSTASILANTGGTITIMHQFALTDPTLSLSQNSISINDTSLTASVIVSGTASGEITETNDLPTGVTVSATADGVTVTGVRPAAGAANISGTFTITITREDVSESLSVNVNLTAQAPPIDTPIVQPPIVYIPEQIVQGQPATPPSGTASQVRTIPANEGAYSVGVRVANDTAILQLQGNVLAQVINSAYESVILDVTNVAVDTCQIPRNALRDFAAASLGAEIVTHNGILSFDADAVASIGQQARNNNVNITIACISGDELNAAQQNAIFAGGEIFRITVSSGNQNISQLNGTLRVTVPYDGELPAAAWRVAADGTLERLPSEYDAATGTLTFTVTHLSVFIVGFDGGLDVEIAPPASLAIRLAIGNATFSLGGLPVQGDAAPFIDAEHNRTMVPLRLIAEGLGADVDFINETRTVVITQNGTEIFLPVGVPIEGGMGTPVIVNGRTFVPVRYVSEILGVSVRWDAENRAVYINE